MDVKKKKRSKVIDNLLFQLMNILQNISNEAAKNKLFMCQSTSQ
jgi:hypothetical protein